MHIYFKQKNEVPILYNSMFFKILQVLFGLHFGAFNYKSRKTEYFAKLICLLQSASISYLCINIMLFRFNKPSSVISACGIFVLYFFYSFILISQPRDVSFLQLVRDLQPIDLKLRAYNAFSDTMKRFGCLLSIYYSYKIVDAIYHGSLYSQGLTIPKYVFIISVALVTDTVNIYTVYLFYIFYHRLNIFAKNLSLADNKMLLSYNVLYKEIADIVEKFKCACEPLYLVTLFCNIPNVMYIIYHDIQFLAKSNDVSNLSWFTLPQTAVVCMMLVLTLFLPFSASMLTKVAHNTIVILHDKLHFEEDESKGKEIQRFIQYVEVRPLKFTVYRVIPLDVSFLGVIISFAVSYLIVIIQFADSAKD